MALASSERGRWIEPELAKYLGGVADQLSSYETVYGVRPYALRVPGGIWPWLNPGDVFFVAMWWGRVRVEVV